MGRTQTLSEATQQLIDSEVRRLVQEAYDTAKRILTEKRAHLEILANGLLEFETLTGEEIVGLLAGKRPTREDSSTPTIPTPSSGISVPASGSKAEADNKNMEPNPV